MVALPKGQYELVLLSALRRLQSAHSFCLLASTPILCEQIVALASAYALVLRLCPSDESVFEVPSTEYERVFEVPSIGAAGLRTSDQKLLSISKLWEF